ncbi:acylphosphatase [bacterium]|nr:acylphosphatase [bacterium]
MKDVCVHLLIEGRVQGVGFRYFALKCAQKLNVTGWVRNNFDGTVEIEVEGDRSAVEEYIAKIKLGPTWGNVKDLSVEYKSYEGKYSSFEVTR